MGEAHESVRRDNQVLFHPDCLATSGIDSHAGATHVAQGLDSWKANYLNVTSALNAGQCFVNGRSGPRQRPVDRYFQIKATP